MVSGCFHIVTMPVQKLSVADRIASAAMLGNDVIHLQQVFVPKEKFTFSTSPLLFLQEVCHT